MYAPRLPQDRFDCERAVGHDHVGQLAAAQKATKSRPAVESRLRFPTYSVQCGGGTLPPK